MARNTVLACVVSAGLAGMWSRDWRVVAGVLAGGVLVGVSFWAIAGAVMGVTEAREIAEKPRVSRGVLLVKFFTRHGILALVAYVMMVRLHLDPVGMIVGVTAVVVAAVIEAARPR